MTSDPPGTNREPDVVLYIRPNCHLCADAGVLLDELLGADGYRVVDVEADDDLLPRYAGRVPVIAIDGADRVEAPVNGPDLLAALSAAGIPV